MPGELFRPEFPLASGKEIAIWDALKRNQWRRLAAARELCIDKNTLRRKIRRFGLQPEADEAAE